jgi:hypothetical protein
MTIIMATLDLSSSFFPSSSVGGNDDDHPGHEVLIVYVVEIERKSCVDQFHNPVKHYTVGAAERRHLAVGRQEPDGPRGLCPDLGASWEKLMIINLVDMQDLFPYFE